MRHADDLGQHAVLHSCDVQMQVEKMVGHGNGARTLGAQEAAMLIWALAVLHELQPNIWNALLDLIAAAPEEALDEVTLSYQNSMCRLTVVSDIQAMVS